MTYRRKNILTALEKHFQIFTPNIWDNKEINEVFNESKIVLNIHLSDLPNIETRIGEVLGSGSFLLTEELSSQDLFADGEHLVQWHKGDIDDLIKQIQYYLFHEDERERIATNGHHFVRKHHTFAKRMHQLLSVIDFNQNKSN